MLQRSSAELRVFQDGCQGLSTFTLGVTSQPTAPVQALTTACSAEASVLLIKIRQLAFAQQNASKDITIASSQKCTGDVE
jgi:hypothetical protein